MRQNEPNIYIGEKKMRSFGGYGQRSRSARAATWCGPREPHSAPTPTQTTENHVCALTTETHIHHPRATDSNNTILFSIYYICWFLLFFPHFDILFFSWCASQLTCCAWPGSICHRSCDRRFSIRYWRVLLSFWDFLTY